MTTDPNLSPRFYRYSLDPAEVASWPDIDLGALDKDAQQEYLRRKQAILYYLGGATDAQLQSEHNLSADWIRKLIKKRCVQVNPDGRIWGWRALVPNGRVNPYKRKIAVEPDASGHGAAGALNHLLSMEPDFRRRLDNYILKKVETGPLEQINRPRHDVHSWFLQELRKLGYEAAQKWPFNVKTLGYSSVVRYMDQLLAANPSRAALIVGGPDLQRKFITGDGTQRPELKPFERVEMDAHKLDCRLCVMIPQPDGDWAPKLIHRLWVIVIIEVTSRAVIGYHLSMNREVTKEDVLRATKMALQKWLPPTMQYANYRLLADAGLPSSYSSKYVGIPWNETSVDGALAQTCRTVKEALRTVVGATVLEPASGYGIRRGKDDRPFIERFFSNLSERGLQRLTVTTGSSPKGKKGRKPEEVAVAAQFQLPYLEELLAALIANYNATPHSSLGYRSPLEMLDFYDQKKALPTRRVDPAIVQSLLSVRKRCMVRGGYKVGRKPYVNFTHARYSGEQLSQRHDLVDKHIWVVNHLDDDARTVQAFDINGRSLGILVAHPPWHRTPHTLEIRAAIASLMNKRKILVNFGGDAVAEFLRLHELPERGKLSVHPIYIKLQRFLAELAARESPQDQVDRANRILSLTNESENSRDVKIDGLTDVQSTDEAPLQKGTSGVKRSERIASNHEHLAVQSSGKANQEPRLQMPARRMAAIKKS